MIDFSNCEVDPGFAYDGANGKKICILYEGERYMMKFPTRPRPRGWNADRIDVYSNSCFSEHVGCRVLKSIGMNSQDTLMGTYNTDHGRRTVVICKDFTAGGKRLIPFINLKNACLKDVDSPGTSTELDEIMTVIQNQSLFDPRMLNEFFWDMFIGDALVGNFDRHNGNWGFLADSSNNYSIAPIFDCGSSLYPQLMTEEYRGVLDDPSEMATRIYARPWSSIKMNDERINYFDFISSLKNEDCNNALLRIVPRIDMNKIHDLIDDMPELSDIQKEFYCTMLTERKEKILDVGYEKLVGGS